MRLQCIGLKLARDGDATMEISEITRALYRIDVPMKFKGIGQGLATRIRREPRCRRRS